MRDVMHISLHLDVQSEVPVGDISFSESSPNNNAACIEDDICRQCHGGRRG